MREELARALETIDQQEAELQDLKAARSLEKQPFSRRIRILSLQPCIGVPTLKTR
jgi:hypothetical protein